MSSEYSASLWLGLDLGSVSIKAVVLDEHNRILAQHYRRTQGHPLQAALELLQDLQRELDDPSLSGCVVTGSGKSLLKEALQAGAVNEIVAHATAAWTLHPEVKSIIEIGGQDSKFIQIEQREGGPVIEDHAFNELCAAGTGAFLDQQAERLGLDIVTFGELAAKTERAARVAGRCSVFAKTDMIHLQQRATPTEEITSGLCFALARNYLVSLCHGKPPAAPVLFQGGVAANNGVQRAFQQLLGLSERDFIRPEPYLVMGALGAALIAREQPCAEPVCLSQLHTALEQAQANHKEDMEARAPLKEPSIEKESEPAATSVSTFGFLGVDVGSVSTKAAVIDPNGKLIASCYLPTAGRPVQAVAKAMAQIEAQLPDKLDIRALATTGSGRHLARELIDADLALDEISAQARSAAQFAPETDTIIEIGGQDSKYIHLSNGQVSRFQMNRACAAGTGAFLEEQAGRLKVDIKKDFARLAFESDEPVRLGSRCTVFMDSDLVHHLQRGASKPDLCAGLAYAIGENFLEKVVGSRPLGERILFQGGVAKNRAVHAVFEKLLGRSVKAHPHPEISGALGAALVARERYETKPREAAWSFAQLVEPSQITSFTCRGCENLCEVQKVSFPGGRQASFGSVCGRYENGSDKPLPAQDAFATRERLLFETHSRHAAQGPRGTIGFPFALSMTEHLPFWSTFFSELGYGVVCSGASNRESVEWGLTHVPAEFCYPIKVLFGQVQRLREKNVDQIFIPHLRLATPPGDEHLRYACAYTQAAPSVIAATTGMDVLSLETPFEQELKYWKKRAANTLQADRKDIERAYKAAVHEQRSFEDACLKAGEALLKRLDSENGLGAVLIGRPYNTTDRYVNLNLARRLQSLGIEPIPNDFLPLAEEQLPGFWHRVRWIYGRQAIKTARVLKRNPRLSAVLVTNFGCGPDAFVDQYLEHELFDTPHIVLEFDEHQAEAGLVTRLEAFAHTLRNNPGKRTQLELGPEPCHADRPLQQYTYYVPHFSDHAHAFIGALRASNCKAVLLPPTDDESWQLGLRHAYGRECHPFISFVGDLLKAAAQPDFDLNGASYYTPSYFGPCLLPQYLLMLRLILDRNGLQGVTLMNIADPPTMSGLGHPYIIRLTLGLYAIDRLYKWKVENEPYEQTPGELQRVHQENLKRIEDGLAGGRFWASLKESVRAFQAVKLRDHNGQRPRIGIVGDVYTRINEHANNHLYDRLDELGFEVWTSCSLVDVAFLGMEQLHRELLRQSRSVSGNGARALIPALFWLRSLVDRYFPDSIRTPQERQFPQVYNAASRHTSFWIDKALSLNLSRIEEFEQAGASGVINTMCHNCMLGTVTAALTPSIRQQMPDLSMCTLVYEGLQSTHNINRLEAFAHQVHSRKKRP